MSGDEAGEGSGDTGEDSVDEDSVDEDRQL